MEDEISLLDPPADDEVSEEARLPPLDDISELTEWSVSDENVADGESNGNTEESTTVTNTVKPRRTLRSTVPITVTST